MSRGITDGEGRHYKKGHPKYENVRIENLEAQVMELQTAVIDLQHRLSRVDGERLQWPGDSYEPTNTQPFEP